MEEESQDISICIMGNGMIGKSSLVAKLLNENYILNEEYDSTVEDNYLFYESINDKKCRVIINDTGDGVKYKSFFSKWIKSSNCFILLYSIDNKASFDDIKKEYYDPIRALKPSADIILLGNKADLEVKRVIKTRDGVSLAKKLKVPFAEISIANSQNIKTQVFTLINGTEEASKKGNCIVF